LGGSALAAGAPQNIARQWLAAISGFWRRSSPIREGYLRDVYYVLKILRVQNVFYPIFSRRASAVIQT
jgi:hypothetical protein